VSHGRRVSSLAPRLVLERGEMGHRSREREGGRRGHNSLRRGRGRSWAADGRLEGRRKPVMYRAEHDNNEGEEGPWSSSRRAETSYDCQISNTSRLRMLAPHIRKRQ